MQNNNITIRQTRLQGHEGLWQITIENGRFSRIEPQEAASLPQGEVLDAEGGLAIPPFVEPHIHLDTTHGRWLTASSTFVLTLTFQILRSPR